MKRVFPKSRKHNLSQTSSNFSFKHYSVQNNSSNCIQAPKKTTNNSFFENFKPSHKISNKTMVIVPQNQRKKRHVQSRFGKFASNKKFLIDSQKNIKYIRESSQFKVRGFDTPSSVEQFFPTHPEDSTVKPNQQKTQINSLLQKTSQKYAEIATLNKFIGKCKIKESLKQVQIIQDKLTLLQSELNNERKIRKRQHQQRFEIERKLKESQVKVCQLQQQCDKMKRIIKNEDPNSYHHQFLQYTQRCRILQQKIRSLEQSETKKNQFIRYLQKKNLAFKQEFAQQRQQFAKIKSKQHQLSQKNKIMSTLEQKVKKLQQQNKQMKTNQQMLKETVAAKNQLIQTMKKKWSQLQQQHQKMNEQFINIQQEHKKQIDDLVELLQQIKQENQCQKQKCLHFRNYKEILQLFNVELDDDKYHCRLLEQIQNFQNMMIKLVNNISEMDDKMWQLKKQRDLMVEKNFVFIEKSEQLQSRLANEEEMFDELNEQLIISQAEKLQVKLINKNLEQQLQQAKYSKQNKDENMSRTNRFENSTASRPCCENAKIIVECGENCSQLRRNKSKIIKSCRSISHFGKVIDTN